MRARSTPSTAQLDAFDDLMIRHEVRRIRNADQWGEHAPAIRRQARESLLLELAHVTGPANQEAREALRALQAGRDAEGFAILDALLARGPREEET